MLQVLFLWHCQLPCDAMKNCKVCQQNTYNSSGTLINSGSETEYCDAALDYVLKQLLM